MITLQVTDTEYLIFRQIIVSITASAFLPVNCNPKSNLGLLQVTTASLEHKTYCMATLVSYNNYVIS